MTSAMGLRERLDGNWWWTLHLEVHGEGCVLVSLLGWVYGRILGEVGRSSHTRFEVRDDSKVRFWHDLWCGDMALKESFPVLFGIACGNDASVMAYVEFFGCAIQQNMSFARAAHDWEVDAFTLFFRALYLVRMRREWEDKQLWVQSKRGLFGVKSFYSAMGYNDDFFVSPLFFFIWSEALGKILTMDNLWKQRVIVVYRCYMRKRNEESANHFFHCEVAFAI